MSTTTIPAVSVVICDCCMRAVGLAGVHRAMGGGLDVRRDALDLHGYACAKADIELDLCDGCLGALCEAINQRCVAIRETLTTNGDAA
ncbi:hypothetical protein X12_001590 [Xanthomonas arboricola]|uniref:hypothetical protein n=1 Tax=Xanthomonas arboricola TaxID=56448 RepID=UPI002B2EA7B3|nr:hypothetical protein X12_001590 [Xanthomonas arboricola]